MPAKFPHVTDAFTRAALEADPRKLSAETMTRLISKTLDHAEADLLDPNVRNAVERSEIAIKAADEPDPVKAHELVQRFWSI